MSKKRKIPWVSKEEWLKQRNEKPIQPTFTGLGKPYYDKDDNDSWEKSPFTHKKY